MSDKKNRRWESRVNEELSTPREEVVQEPIPEKKRSIYFVNTESLNVRAAPQGHILFLITKGTRVYLDFPVVNDNLEWARATLLDNETKVGFVMTGFLKEETEE